VAGTLGWQTYGDQAREMLVGAYPQLSGLLPRAASAQTVVATTGVSGRAAAAVDYSQQIQEIALRVGEMRQRVDYLSQQLDQGTRDITAKVQTAERDILDKIAAGQPRQEAATTARRQAAPPMQPTQLR